MFIFCSLIGTAKFDGFDTEAYLSEVFARIIDVPIIHTEELLPWNIVATALNVIKSTA